MTAAVTPIGHVGRAVAYTTATPAQLAEIEVAHALATVTVLRPALDDRPSPRHCECEHDGHRPLEMFGRTSRYRVTGSGPGHARGARLRDVDGWFSPAQIDGPRVCEDCHHIGHDR